MKKVESDHGGPESPADEVLEMIVRQGGIDLFPSDTRAEVERILAPGQAVEPHVRKRLVDAARRGALVRSAGRRPVERLLFDRRIAANKSIEDVAELIGVDAAMLVGVERGSGRIKDLDAISVAAWVGAIEVDRETAISALTVSLTTASRSHAYAASPAARLNPDDAKFVARVRTALGLDESDAD